MHDSNFHLPQLNVIPYKHNYTPLYWCLKPTLNRWKILADIPLAIPEYVELCNPPQSYLRLAYIPCLFSQNAFYRHSFRYVVFIVLLCTEDIEGCVTGVHLPIRFASHYVHSVL